MNKKLDELSTLPKDMDEAFNKIRHLEDKLKAFHAKTDIEV